MLNLTFKKILFYFTNSKLQIFYTLGVFFPAPVVCVCESPGPAGGSFTAIIFTANVLHPTRFQSVNTKWGSFQTCKHSKIISSYFLFLSYFIDYLDPPPTKEQSNKNAETEEVFILSEPYLLVLHCNEMHWQGLQNLDFTMHCHLEAEMQNMLRNCINIPCHWRTWYGLGFWFQ